jgi:hypothetical protein
MFLIPQIILIIIWLPIYYILSCLYMLLFIIALIIHPIEKIIKIRQNNNSSTIFTRNFYNLNTAIRSLLVIITWYLTVSYFMWTTMP